MHSDKIKHKVFVDISDTGIGMTKKTIDVLFQKFSRADNANSVNIKGTGLGLFVAREMALAMKCDITCSSQGEGKGSLFTVTLPMSDRD